MISIKVEVTLLVAAHQAAMRKQKQKAQRHLGGGGKALIELPFRDEAKPKLKQAATSASVVYMSASPRYCSNHAICEKVEIISC
jgi:hypothetical protein